MWLSRAAAARGWLRRSLARAGVRATRLIDAAQPAAPATAGPNLKDALLWGIGKWGKATWGPEEYVARPLCWKGIWGRGRWGYFFWRRSRTRVAP